MKTSVINIPNYRPLMPEIIVNNSDFIRVSKPSTVCLMNVRNLSGILSMDASIEGLTEHNFSLKIAGNRLVVIIEKKKELTKKSTWGDVSLMGNNEKYYYSIFERSDIFLPGNEDKQLISAEYKQGMLKISIAKNSNILD
jgi:HSP20 family molecular chaperone IbpA